MDCKSVQTVSTRERLQGAAEWQPFFISTLFLLHYLLSAQLIKLYIANSAGLALLNYLILQLRQSKSRQ